MWDYYVMGIILLPGIILSIYAQAKVSITFNKYNNVLAECGKSASEIARLFLDFAGLKDIKIIKVRGHLTDYYNHRKKIIALSDLTYESSSISAIGVACHEVGHALQYKTNYLPIKIRNLFIPICNFANYMLWFWIILGIIFYAVPLGMTFTWIGIACFGVTVLLNLITLPVEYNASKRAIQLVSKGGIFGPEETEDAKKILNAAALTYVASLVVSILNLVRLILVFARRDD